MRGENAQFLGPTEEAESWPLWVCEHEGHRSSNFRSEKEAFLKDRNKNPCVRCKWLERSRPSAGKSGKSCSCLAGLHGVSLPWHAFKIWRTSPKNAGAAESLSGKI